MSKIRVYMTGKDELSSIALGGKGSEGDPLAKKFIGFLPQLYAEKYMMAGQESALMRAIGSGYLLRKYMGIKSETEIKHTEHGKPYVEGFDKSFSISHDDDLTILAISDTGEDMGADIEKISNPSESLVRRMFPEEWAKVLSEIEDKEERALTFCKYWTGLEAILKAQGTGFDADYRRHPEMLEGWTVRHVIYKNYVIAVATRYETDDTVLLM